jgi:serine/threonine protein kinase
VVHRDLKPANTFLARVTNEPRPIVKLLDFGLAKLAAGADDRVERTQAGVVIGTAMYLSPEQARGPNVDGRSDVYALGCIAYELVLGARPFPDARSTPALIAAHLHDRPAPPRAIWPEIPAALDLLLFGLLAKDPAYRPTLAQVRQLIAGVRGSSPAAAPVPRLAHLADHAARPRASRPALAALVVLAMLGGALITAISLGRCAPASSPPAPAPAHGARDR